MSEPEKKQRDTRKSRRIRKSLRAIIYGEPEPFKSYTVDLSLSGAFLTMREPFPVGAKAVVDIFAMSPSTVAMRFIGRVVRAVVFPQGTETIPGIGVAWEKVHLTGGLASLNSFYLKHFGTTPYHYDIEDLARFGSEQASITYSYETGDLIMWQGDDKVTKAARRPLADDEFAQRGAQCLPEVYLPVPLPSTLNIRGSTRKGDTVALSMEDVAVKLEGPFPAVGRGDRLLVKVPTSSGMMQWNFTILQCTVTAVSPPYITASIDSVSEPNSPGGFEEYLKRICKVVYQIGK